MVRKALEQLGRGLVWVGQAVLGAARGLDTAQVLPVRQALGAEHARTYPVVELSRRARQMVAEGEAPRHAVPPPPMKPLRGSAAERATRVRGVSDGR
jgi:hypothetical protein